MTLCPIALAVGCKKCPAFKICPLKRVLGDQAAAVAVEPVVEKVPARPPMRTGAPKRKPRAKPAAGRKPAAGKK